MAGVLSVRKEDMNFSEYNQHRQWVLKEKHDHVYYGSCWWTIAPGPMVVYTEDHLSKWTTREIMKMHYYLTARLDGYGHLTADQTVKDNCTLFRNVLAERGHDGVDNCMQNEMFYDCGYRSWQYTESPIGEKREKPATNYVRIGF